MDETAFYKILENICLMSQTTTREIVREALVFLKGMISMKDQKLSLAHLELIVSNVAFQAEKKLYF